MSETIGVFPGGKKEEENNHLVIIIDFDVKKCRVQL